MRWGLIGTGKHAIERIVPALSATGQVLAGAVGSSPEKSAAFVAQAGMGRAYPSLEALLASPEVEAVFVSTPNDRHRDEVIAAAHAGKHVLVEKPMALTEADCRAMIAACDQAGVALGLGFQQRHAPVHREIKSLIGSGALGEIVLLRGEWHTAYPPWTNWRADLSRAGSDVLGAVGVHVLDLLCWLAGSEVTDIAALADREGGADRTVVASMRFQGGPIATMTATARARAATNSIWVLGTHGSACGVGTLGMNPTARLETVIDGKAEVRDLPLVDLYAAQLAAFADAVAEGRPPSADGADGLRSVVLSQRILAAAR